MNENSETQNTSGEESQPETIGELLSEETEETTETEEKSEGTESTEETDTTTETTIETTEEAKEEKKERDFEKGMHKFRDLYKEEKAKREELETKTTESVETTGDQEAIDILRGIVREELAPLKEDRVWDDFEKRPYVDVLKPEIIQELDKLSENLSLDVRLEQARKNAIANNLETIIKTSKEMGKEEAYSNQDIKSRQTGIQTSARKGETKTLLDKIKSGELSDQEWRENSGEIERVMKEEIY